MRVTQEQANDIIENGYPDDDPNSKVRHKVEVREVIRMRGKTVYNILIGKKTVKVKGKRKKAKRRVKSLAVKDPA